MLRFVVLLHTLPDGSSHFDWLLERPAAEGGEPGGLMAWRLEQFPGARCAAVRAERMEDHRRIYLEYEGPVSGGRGSVRRVVEGQWLPVAESEDGAEFRVRFEEGGRLIWMHWVARREGGGSVWSLAGRMIENSEN